MLFCYIVYSQAVENEGLGAWGWGLGEDNPTRGQGEVFKPPFSPPFGCHPLPSSQESPLLF